MKINVKTDLPYAKTGEINIPNGVIDENFAAVLVKKGLADLIEGELPTEEVKQAKTEQKKGSKRINPGE